MMDKERRAEQITRTYLRALKGLESGTIEDCVLVPFKSDEKVEINIYKSDGEVAKVIVNATI